METNPKYFINGYSLENVRNRHEIRVVAALRKVMAAQPDFCGCRLCVEDVYAAALNKLPPHYIQAGAMVLRRLPPSDEQVEQTVREVLDRVHRNPNHEASPQLAATR
jgi:hypothetical protein